MEVLLMSCKLIFVKDLTPSLTPCCTAAEIIVLYRSPVTMTILLCLLDTVCLSYYMNKDISQLMNLLGNVRVLLEIAFFISVLFANFCILSNDSCRMI